MTEQLMDSAGERALAELSERELIRLASDLVRIPSFKTEETELSMWLRDFFADRGYRVDLQEVEPGRFQTIATLKGDGGGRSLMFNGHVDIDPLALGWTRHPWTPTVEGSRLYGAGLENMKGGVAAMIAAVECIRKAGIRLRGDLVIACVVGELQGGVGTVHLLNSGVRTDMAVVTEPMGVGNVTLVHSGWTQLAVSVVGYSTHVIEKAEADDAIKMMLEVIPAVENLELRHEPDPNLPALPLLTVGGIIGGRGRDHDLKGPNFISDYCTILLDVRFLPSQTAETVRDDIEGLLDEFRDRYPRFQFEVEQPPGPRYKAQRVHMNPIAVPENEYIAQALRRHSVRVTGEEPRVGFQVPLSYGGDDTCHLWEAGIPCALFGPVGVRPTKEMPDHSMEIDELVTATKILVLTALDVCETTD